MVAHVLVPEVVRPAHRSAVLALLIAGRPLAHPLLVGMPAALAAVLRLLTDHVLDRRPGVRALVVEAHVEGIHHRDLIARAAPVPREGVAVATQLPGLVLTQSIHGVSLILSTCSSM